MEDGEKMRLSDLILCLFETCVWKVKRSSAVQDFGRAEEKQIMTGKRLGIFQYGWKARV